MHVFRLYWDMHQGGGGLRQMHVFVAMLRQPILRKSHFRALFIILGEYLLRLTNFKVVLKSGPFELFVSCTYITVISSWQQLVCSLGLLLLTIFSNKTSLVLFQVRLTIRT